MTKKQTKFTNALDLQAAVLRLKKEYATQMRLAAVHQTKMQVFWDNANDPTNDNQSYNRTRGFAEKRLAERNLKLARRIEEVKLPKLKQALAQFNTQTFEFSKDDKSVVIN
jgi:hypothetical protein